MRRAGDTAESLALSAARNLDKRYNLRADATHGVTYVRFHFTESLWLALERCKSLSIDMTNTLYLSNAIISQLIIQIQVLLAVIVLLSEQNCDRG